MLGADEGDPTSEDSTPRGALPPLGGAAIVALCGLVYAGALQGPFIFDDAVAITRNPFIESLLPLSSSMDAPPGSGASGRPIVALSLAVNYFFGEREVFGYHLFNVLVHVLAGLTLFGLVRRTLTLVRERIPTGLDPTLLATLAGAMWVLHPLHTAPLNQVIYRNEALMGLAYFFTLYAAARGLTGGRRSLWLTLAVVACAVGTGCKEVIVTAPVVVLLYDRTFVAGNFGDALRRNKALYLGLALTWGLLAWVVSLGYRGDSVGFELEGVAPGDYLLTQAGSLVRYLYLFFWPADLVLDYTGWPLARSIGAVFWQGLLILTLVALALRAQWRGRAVGFLLLAFFLVLSPTSTFIPLTGALVGEHRMYVPTAALIVLSGMGVLWLLEKAGVDAGRRPLVLVSLTVLSGVALGTRTVLRNTDFRTAVRIWQDTVEKRPGNFYGWNNLGVALAEEERTEEAEAAYRECLRIKPGHASAYTNLGNLFVREDRLDLAMEHFQRSLAIRDNDPGAHYNLAIIFKKLGREEEAIPHLLTTMQIDPGGVFGKRAPNRLADTRYSLGARYISQGRTPEGIVQLREAMRLAPDKAPGKSAANHLAWLLATSTDEGVRDPAEALVIARTLVQGKGAEEPVYLRSLAAAQFANGRAKAAAETARRGIALAKQKGYGPLATELEGLLATYAARARNE